MGIDAFISRTLQSQRSKLKHCRLGQYVADACTIEIYTLCSLKHLVDPIHSIFVQRKPGIGYCFIIKNGQCMNDIRIRAFSCNGLPLQHLGEPVFLIDFLYQFQLKVQIACKAKLLA